VEGGLSDKSQINFLYNILENHIHHILQAKRQAQRIKFHLMIAAIHGRDIHCKMPFSVNILPDFIAFAGKDDLLQSFEVSQ